MACRRSQVDCQKHGGDADAVDGGDRDDDAVEADGMVSVMGVVRRHASAGVGWGGMGVGGLGGLGEQRTQRWPGVVSWPGEPAVRVCR